MNKIIYFVSDHHFGRTGREDPARAGATKPTKGAPTKEATKLHKFLEFIEHIKGCEALFIVGDFFDFYFEYKTQIPKAYFPILNALWELKKSGTQIHYIVGNHDFWIGDFFTKQLGARVYKKPLELTLQGRKVFIAHGNEFSRFDPTKWILRNKLSIFLFHWIHPDIAWLIGRWVSNLSSKTGTAVKWEKLYDIAEQKFDAGFDAVIFGHIHFPKHIKHQNKDFLLLGDWIRYFSYGKLELGKFKLCYQNLVQSLRPVDE